MGVVVSKEIELEQPIQLDGRTLSTVTMRRVKVKDMLVHDKRAGSDGEKELHLIANLCELPPSALEDMDMADYGELQGVLKSFLSRAPKNAAPAS